MDCGKEEIMKKIISLFKRNYEGDRQIINEIVEGAEWVVTGEGIATRKFDGTACAIINNKFYKRYDVKKGKNIPLDAIPCQEPDLITGHHPHWVLIGNGSEDKYFREALKGNEPDGTYELCGEKINNNSEGFTGHHLIPHGKEIITDVPRTFDELKEWFRDKNIEGIVWWHPDGRMVKIKKKDFGLKRTDLY